MSASATLSFFQMLTKDSLPSFDPSLPSALPHPENYGKMVTGGDMVSDADRSQLRDMLVARSLKLGRVFRLSSGATSDRYMDAKLTTLQSAAMPLIGRLFNRKMQGCGWSPTAVGGLTLGADPIAFSVARESVNVLGRSIQAFIVRKEPKEHGMTRFIEGFEDDETENMSVVIIDDVCTRGNSTGKAVERARAARMNVLGAICLVDRGEGASQLLRDNYACDLVSLFTLDELVKFKMMSESVQNEAMAAS